MSIVNIKEVLKEFNLAKKHFKKAIELAKKNMIVGEVNFPGDKKTKPRKKAATAGEEQPTT